MSALSFVPDLTGPATVLDRARAKIAWRILPFVFVLYIIAWLDRANVSFAKTRMAASLGFSEAIFGFGAGIFFIGYFIFEIPGALLVERGSARRFLCRIMLTWGLCTMLIGFVQTKDQFYLLRFLLGAAEAGFFPGMIVYLTHWFPAQARGRALSGLVIGTPGALAISAPLSSWMLGLNWLGWEGWRWLFVLQGVPAVVMGVVTWFYLTDRPGDAHWLAPEERAAVEDELGREASAKGTRARLGVWGALSQPNVLMLAGSLFGTAVASYSFLFWLPSVIQRELGTTAERAALWTFLPYTGGVIAILVSGRSSDRLRERRLHAGIPLILAAVFLFLSSMPRQPFWLLMIWLSLTVICWCAWMSPFWVLPTLSLSASAAAASIALINSVGNLGGFFGPSLSGYLRKGGSSEMAVVGAQACAFLIAGVLILLLPIRQDSQAKNPTPS